MLFKFRTLVSTRYQHSFWHSPAKFGTDRGFHEQRMKSECAFLHVGILAQNVTWRVEIRE